MPEPLSGIVTDALRRVRRSSGVPLAFAGVLNGPSNLRLQHFAGSTVGALRGCRSTSGTGWAARSCR